jgi:hypothetical protein
VDVLFGLTLAAPAGLNAYIPLFALSLAERYGWVNLLARQASRGRPSTV